MRPKLKPGVRRQGRALAHRTVQHAVEHIREQGYDTPAEEPGRHCSVDSVKEQPRPQR